MMNDSEDAWAALSWQAAGARGRVCAHPQLGSEACSREGMSQWEGSKMWNLKQLLAGSPFFCSQAP